MKVKKTMEKMTARASTTSSSSSSGKTDAADVHVDVQEKMQSLRTHGSHPVSHVGRDDAQHATSPGLLKNKIHELETAGEREARVRTDAEYEHVHAPVKERVKLAEDRDKGVVHNGGEEQEHEGGEGKEQREVQAKWAAQPVKQEGAKEKQGGEGEGQG